jgi:hypothetical protein
MRVKVGATANRKRGFDTFGLAPGPPVRAESHYGLPKFDALLHAVMAVFTKGLEIIGVKEQCLTAFVRHDVIGDCRNYNIFVI